MTTTTNPNYVSQATQTDIEGLVHDPAPRPAALVPRVPDFVDNTTPPVEEEMLAIDKLQVPAEGTPSLTRTDMDNPHVSPTLLLRRKNRPQMVARISMPNGTQFDPQNPRSPPPTEAVMSPLPAANRLHAGHTPIVPRARSPLPESDDEDTDTSEQEDAALSGALTLPPRPGDGTEDTIPLSRLDAELEKLRLEQEHSTELEGSQSSRTSPTEVQRRRSFAEESVEVVDGVRLKKAKLNFGAPLGQA